MDDFWNENNLTVLVDEYFVQIASPNCEDWASVTGNFGFPTLRKTWDFIVRNKDIYSEFDKRIVGMDFNGELCYLENLNDFSIEKEAEERKNFFMRLRGR